MANSMTGFARQELQQPWGTLTCEIRSVNHRYLEPSLRLAESLRALESPLREALRKHLHRGKVDASLFLKTEDAQVSQLELNPALAQQILSLATSISSQIDDPAAINPLDVLRWPGVMQSADIDREQLHHLTTELFTRTLGQLNDNRAREGQALAGFIEQRLQQIGEHVAIVRSAMPTLLAQQQARLRQKIDALQVEVDEARFSQEVVYLAQKADVNEELERLDAHIDAVRHSLQQRGPIGRRLDFLMQELNREANTLSAKSLNSQVTQSAVEIKVCIEQMREQIQNIE